MIVSMMIVIIYDDIYAIFVFISSIIYCHYIYEYVTIIHCHFTKLSGSSEA